MCVCTLQESIAKAHGTQCGFCTPGMVVSMSCLLQNNKDPSVVDIEDCLQGNLCRCTGYRPIIAGCKSFVKGSSEKHCSDFNIDECSQVAQVSGAVKLDFCELYWLSTSKTYDLDEV